MRLKFQELEQLYLSSNDSTNSKPTTIKNQIKKIQEINNDPAKRKPKKKNQENQII